MAYQRLGLKDFDTANPFAAKHVEHIEDGIIQNESDISDLNADLTYKTYSAPSQIDSSLSSSSTIPEIIDKMSNGMMLVCRGTDIDITGMDNGSNVSSVIIIRVTGSRYIIQGFRAYSGVSDAQSKQYYATYDNTDMHGWFELAKADDVDIMGATGTAIQSGDDLNNYLTPGKYYSQNSSISGTLTNAPFTTAGFNLYVFKQVVAANTVFQLAVRTSTSTANILAVRICSSGSWGDWYLLSASALSTTSLSNKPEDGDV